MLKHIAPAYELLAEVNTEQIKDQQLIFIINVNYAKLAVLEGNAELAEQYLKQLSTIPHSINNKFYFSQLLVQAECALLKNDTTSAGRRLDEIISYCPNIAILKQAQKIKAELAD